MTAEFAPTSLTFPTSLHAQMLMHARESLPREAVGLLGGTADGMVSKISPLTNVFDGDEAFLADPYDQFIAIRDLQSRHLHLLAIYHSHPGGGIGPSRLDLQYARQWSCFHLIIAIGGQGARDGECRAFRVSTNGAMQHVPVAIVHRM